MKDDRFSIIAIFALIFTVGLCLPWAAELQAQTQKPASVRSGDMVSTVLSPVEPDSPGTSSTVAAGPQAVVPRLMKFGGVLLDASGKPLTGTVDVTFSLYNTEAGGSPLWFETQSVQADELGRYTALLGAMHTDGLPVDLFTSGDVRWLGIQVGSEAEQQPRVLLVSVPYALKAGDAETLGGKPASAYMLSNSQQGTTSTTSIVLAPAGSMQTNIPAANQQTRSANTSALTACSGLTSSGTAAANAVPYFTSTCNIEGSSIVEYNGNLGFGIATPQARLHIFGPTLADADAHFNFILGDSTPAAAGTGGGIDFSGYYNGTTNKAGFGNIRGVKENGTQGNYASALIFDTRINGGNQTERMRITSAGNLGIGTSTPTAKLEVNGTAKFDGLVTFAGGQTFPGLGSVTSVASGAGLTGGPITTSGTLSVATGGVTNGMLVNSALTVTAGSGLSGGGSVALGGTTTLSLGSASCVAGQAVVALPLSCVPFAKLGPNVFTGTQAISTSSGAALNAESTGSGSFGVVGVNNDVAGGTGAAGVFINTAGGTILAVNDGNENVISVDTHGLNINQPIIVSPQNDPTTATVLNELTKLNSAGNSVPTTTSDRGGAIGIVVSGAGTSATSPYAGVAVIGVAGCLFDNTAVESDYVQISYTAGGECHDAGANYPSGNGQVLGRVVEASKTPPLIYLFGTEVRAGVTKLTMPACVSSASPAVCGSNSAGSVALPSSATTLEVDTAAVTPNSQIMLQEDSSLSTKLSVTCNTTAGRSYAVTARSAGTSFTITTSSAPSSNPACLSYVIID